MRNRINDKREENNIGEDIIVLKGEKMKINTTNNNEKTEVIKTKSIDKQEDKKVTKPTSKTKVSETSTSKTVKDSLPKVTKKRARGTIEDRSRRTTTSKSKSGMNNRKEIINQMDMDLFHYGKNYESYKMMGAHITAEKGKTGVRFTTWAPNAKRLWVVGDFCDFKVCDKYSMEKKSSYGIWSIFIEGLKAGEKYKFAIEAKDNNIRLKADPYARYSEMRPDTASIVASKESFSWTDSSWITKRKKKDIYKMAVNIYEVHLGSWKTKDGEFMSYDELSETLPSYVEEMGYTHIEIMPLVEHPLDASWGYQGTGYYSLTSRYGSIEGFKKLVNTFHKKNIGVILDWVPGHFCKDAHGLYLFDGEPTYEYQEEWRANNSGWGTYNFDLGRTEVKSFLISNAMFWIEEFHVDGIRVDAVSNILYLDYDRNHGEWRANIYGSNENIEGIQFIKDLNTAVLEKHPNFMMIAEESTAWPKVCESSENGGLGFNFKWNMGWMNDVLEYIQIDTMFRKMHHRKLTFPMMYNYAENYLLPISHDEVVHGKKSLINKMFGDTWSKYAGFKLFMSFMMGHPGKKLTFMGCEFAQLIEWREYEQLDWYLLDDPIHKKMQDCIKALNKLYTKHKCLYELDHDIDGFEWIDADNSGQSVYSFVRKSEKEEDALVFICNFKQESYEEYSIGVPYDKNYVEVFNSDDKKYGGTGQVMGRKLIKAEEVGEHNKPYSITIKVPPMGAVILGVQNKRRKK